MNCGDRNLARDVLLRLPVEVQDRCVNLLADVRLRIDARAGTSYVAEPYDVLLARVEQCFAEVGLPIPRQEQ